jgi:hypothetical protein
MMDATRRDEGGCERGKRYGRTCDYGLGTGKGKVGISRWVRDRKDGKGSLSVLLEAA